MYMNLLIQIIDLWIIPLTERTCFRIISEYLKNLETNVFGDNIFGVIGVKESRILN